MMEARAGRAPGTLGRRVVMPGDGRGIAKATRDLMSRAECLTREGSGPAAFGAVSFSSAGYCLGETRTLHVDSYSAPCRCNEPWVRVRLLEPLHRLLV